MKYEDFMDKLFDGTVIGAVGDAIFDYSPPLIGAPVLFIGWIIPATLLYGLYHLLAPRALRRWFEK